MRLQQPLRFADHVERLFALETTTAHLAATSPFGWHADPAFGAIAAPVATLALSIEPVRQRPFGDATY